MKHWPVFLALALTPLSSYAISNFVFQDVTWRKEGPNAYISGTLVAWTETDPNADSICEIAGWNAPGGECWVGINTSEAYSNGAAGVTRLGKPRSAQDLRNAWVSANGLPFHFVDIRTTETTAPWTVTATLYAGETENNQGLPLGNSATPVAPDVHCSFTSPSLTLQYGNVQANALEGKTVSKSVGITCTDTVSITLNMLNYTPAGLSLRDDDSIKALMTVDGHDMSTGYVIDGIPGDTPIGLTVQSTLTVPGNTLPSAGPFSGNIVLVSSIE